MAEEYPQTEITGVDLSPIQPNDVPGSVKFEIDDIEDVWTWPEDNIDLIYSKTMLVGSIKNSRKYFEQASEHCAPDGYFECLEMTNICSDHYEIPEVNG